MRSEPPPQPLCVITNQPARYRDPKTGLPYYNAAAYRELQRVARGEYRWSEPLAAYVGDPTARAAKGVPARFLDPKAKRETFPPPPVNAKEETADKADEKASVGTGPLDKEGLPVQQKANDDPDGQAALPQSAQQPQVPARPTEGLAQ